MEGLTLTAKSKKNIKVLKFLILGLFFIALAIGITVVGCNYITNRNFKETFYSVSSLKVNNTIRVIHVSDLHSSTYGKNNKKLIDRVEKLEPDVIICTGDCVDSADKKEEKVVSLCGSFAEIAPTYYVYGNNEVERYYGYSLSQESLDEKFEFDESNRKPEKLLELTDEFTKELEKTGVKVLKNSQETITVEATTIDIYGVLTSNPSSFWSYGGESFDKFIYENESNFKIFAIHEPFVFEEFEPKTWGDIMFAGHTHGGTVKIPMVGPLYTKGGGLLPEREGHFVYGRYDVQGRPLIISGGLENKNAFRINNQPELVIVDINRF